MNRGSSKKDALKQVAPEASMRPRFMNRGSCCRPSCADTSGTGFNEAPIHESGKLVDCRASVAVGRASMRPRFMNRGSDDDLACLAPCFLGFNEAPIHESGKSRARSCSVRVSAPLQ